MHYLLLTTICYDGKHLGIEKSKKKTSLIWPRKIAQSATCK